MNSSNLPSGGSQGNLDLWGNAMYHAATAVVSKLAAASRLLSQLTPTVPPAPFSSMHSDWSGLKQNKIVFFFF